MIRKYLENLLKIYDLSRKEVRIYLELLKEKKEFTIKYFTKKFKVTERTARKYIKKFLNLGLLKRYMKKEGKRHY